MIKASLGTATQLSETLNLSASNEGIFAYLGTDFSTPTTLLTGFFTDDPGFGDLTGSGLTLGTDAINTDNNEDVFEFIGDRSTPLTPAAYRSLLVDENNYAVQGGSGDQSMDGTIPDLPFDLTPFTLGNQTLPVVAEFSSTIIPVQENAGAFQLEVTLDTTPSAALTIDVNFRNDSSAVEGVDFTYPTAQTLTFPAEITSQTISIPVLHDNVADPDTYATFELTGASSGLSLR